MADIIIYPKLPCLTTDHMEQILPEIQQILNEYFRENHKVWKNGNGDLVVTPPRILDVTEQSFLSSLCGLKADSLRLLEEPEQLLAFTTSGLGSSRPDTVRVSNVPDDMTISELQVKLNDLFGGNARVHSLARNHPHMEAGLGNSWKKCATVTFPAILNERVRELVKKSDSTETDSSAEGVRFFYDMEFRGVTPLHDYGEKALVDIIAIEGLGTNAFGTWRSPQGDQMWLRDFLKEIIPSCRVLLYGYESLVSETRVDQNLTEIVTTCSNVITDFRELTNTTHRPIIWIGQSMGGLIIQELLARGKEEKMQKKQGKAPNLLDNSKGLLGYGVPMSGLRNDSLLKAVEGHSNHQMIKSISLNGNKPSDYLIELAERFKECSTELPRSRIYYFYETKTSIDKRNRSAPPMRMVLPPEQGKISEETEYYLPLDHSELVKFSNRGEYAYIITYQALLSIVRDLGDAQKPAFFDNSSAWPGNTASQRKPSANNLEDLMASISRRRPLQ